MLCEITELVDNGTHGTLLRLQVKIFQLRLCWQTTIILTLEN